MSTSNLKVPIEGAGWDDWGSRDAGCKRVIFGIQLVFGVFSITCWVMEICTWHVSSAAWDVFNGK